MPNYQSFYDRAGNEMTAVEAKDLCLQSYWIQPSQSTVVIDGQTLSIESREIVGGFAAYRITKPGGWNALVFRGSDDWRDWVLNNVPGAILPVPPPQYGSGRRMARRFQDGTTLVGHSLGGGIASYAAAQQGMDAVTIFPAPINPAWLAFPLPPWPAEGTNILNYVAGGEILTVAAAASPHLRRYGRDVWVQSDGGGPVDKHDLTKIRF
ncbi:MAG: hypothetical protein AB1Z98_24800 [Nannocystaceae bacterium]